MTESIYDKDDYYAADRAASRLTPALNGLLAALERTRVRTVLRRTGLVRGHILDIGAGDGKFLAACKARGFEVEGTTASERSQAAALSQFGVSLVLTQSLECFRESPPFDLLTYWHVFEHLDDPASHAALWSALLRFDGHLVIEVPNVRSLGAWLCYRAWLGSDDRHHINHQAPPAIAALVRAAGLEVWREEGFSLKFSYVFLWSALLGRIFGKRYDFDGLMALLKAPLASLRRRPLAALNALASIAYLLPLILGLMGYGLLTGRGEVYRLYARHCG
jgi:SAM-dependent methyltransferase